MSPLGMFSDRHWRKPSESEGVITEDTLGRQQEEKQLRMSTSARPPNTVIFASFNDNTTVCFCSSLLVLESLLYRSSTSTSWLVDHLIYTCVAGDLQAAFSKLWLITLGSVPD